MSKHHGTIKIPRESFEEHNDRRKELGLTWEEYIDGSAPQHGVPDADELAATIEAAMDIGDMTKRLDALRAELPSDVADELEGRFR